MRISASVLTFAKIAAVITAATAAGCASAHAGRIYADTPALPYQAPDIDELTGIDSDTDADASGSGAGSAQNPQK